MPHPSPPLVGSLAGFVGWALLGFTTAIVGGCRSHTTSDVPLPRPDQPTNRKVIAQGQILPASGFIQLVAQPGDVVEEVRVAVGDTVEAGQVLAVMRSQAIRAAKQAALMQQRSEAAREQSHAETLAQQQVAAAELELLRVQSQQQAQQRNADLLELARQQVEASQAVLSKLEEISADALTSEFVGKLELDRQRLAVGEAQLDYRRQQELYRQATEDLQWAERAAQGKLQAAQAILKAATESQATHIIDLQIEALELENAAAEIVAPEPGVILAVGATKGEASLQLPLIEMANNTAIVCEVEINELDAAAVAAGQPATIRSRAFPELLSGHVRQKFQLVGRPQLRPLDPLARVDYRTVTAIIDIDPESAELARDWLQLQVEVEIATQ